MIVNVSPQNKVYSHVQDFLGEQNAGLMSETKQVADAFCLFPPPVDSQIPICQLQAQLRVANLLIIE